MALEGSLRRVCSAGRLAITVAIALAIETGCVRTDSVVLQPVPSPAYPDAVAPGALHWACAKVEDRLRAYFAERSLPMLPALVQERDGLRCHILYEPTLRGFRALPEQAPVSGLWAAPNTISFLSGRREVIGDTMDVARQMLRGIRRPLDVNLVLSGQAPQNYEPEALRAVFPESPHRFHLHRVTGLDVSPWVQDFLKAGSVDGERMVLVPRQAFEGDPNNGSKYRTLLDSLQGPSMRRSKLSWEGGDLQFVVEPSGGNRTILLFGTSAKRYVGDAVSFSEFAYLLQLEFGADRAVYLGDLTPHVDYLVAVLPHDPVALVSEPVCGSSRLARAALDELLHRVAPGQPVPQELAALDAFLGTAGSGAPLSVSAVPLVQAALQAEPSWRHHFDASALQRIQRYRESHCAASPDACFEGKELKKLLQEQPDLLRQWVKASEFAATEAIVGVRLLQVIASQVNGCNESLRQGFNKSAAALESIGYRVVRVPWVPGTAEGPIPWAGISYVNAAAIDHQIFVPAFGLKGVEEEWFRDLQAKLPASYRVVPVQARYLLMTNGGVHCALALDRSPHAVATRQLTRIPASGASAPAARHQPAGEEPLRRAAR